MKEIKTNGITILLIEVPEDAREFKIENGLLLFKADFIPFGIVILPQGQYQILGKSTELSEEQMKEIVEVEQSVSYWDDPNDEYYVNYNINSNLDRQFFHTVQESYLSLLEANGIVDRNPISDEQKNVDRFWQVEWQEAQSKVKHYLVLKRI